VKSRDAEKHTRRQGYEEAAGEKRRQEESRQKGGKSGVGTDCPAYEFPRSMQGRSVLASHGTKSRGRETTEEEKGEPGHRNHKYYMRGRRTGNPQAGVENNPRSQIQGGGQKNSDLLLQAEKGRNWKRGAKV